jgi:hypothetical protein
LTNSLPPEPSTESFTVTFASAVHGGLDKVLGQSGADAVLVRMEMTNSLPDPAEFHKKLLALFGAQGTLSLERAIVKDLAIRLKWSLGLLKMEDTFDFGATMRTIERRTKA